MTKSSAPRSRSSAKRVARPVTETTSASAQKTKPVFMDVNAKQSNRDAIGRIPVIDVFPVIQGGKYPAKAVVGELLPIRATVFREGHDAVWASVILTSPSGKEYRTDMTQVEPKGLDQWEAWVRIGDEPGQWTFRVEGWSSPWHTWKHSADAKLPLNLDVNLVCAEAQQIFEQAAKNADAAADSSSAVFLRSAASVLIPERDPEDLIEVVDSKALARAMASYAPRELISPTQEFPLWVDRKRALFGAWYEFFPRSQGAHYDPATNSWTSGTLRGSFERLEAAAQMGFDVVYLPPIHPVGTAFRKGKNNTLTPEDGDPGSPWAIGSPDGGHEQIHPDLGTIEDFDAFVDKAKDLGLEVALDFALQCSPDHPWVKQHPEWFSTRVDGTIAYAENPPKKYQDIYPINFDQDPEGIYHEVFNVLEFWINHGVTIFRVDNPHTKPVSFWAWLMAEMRQKHPEVLFLAEAFTRPAMMQSLGRIGFHQGYTYFTWRNSKEELEQYLTEVCEESAHRFRPNFFTNTPDINPLSVRSGRPSAFAIRTILASTMSPSWGMYSGWELFEHIPLKEGGEEYLDSEKYEYRPRNFNAEPNLNLLIGKLNQIRHDHPALQQLRQTHIQHSSSPEVIAFTKQDGDDRMIVICSLADDHDVESTISLDMESLGLRHDAVIRVKDELSGQSYVWGALNYVRLNPHSPAHIMSIHVND